MRLLVSGRDSNGSRRPVGSPPRGRPLEPVLRVPLPVRDTNKAEGYLGNDGQSQSYMAVAGADSIIGHRAHLAPAGRDAHRSTLGNRAPTRPGLARGGAGAARGHEGRS